MDFDLHCIITFLNCTFCTITTSKKQFTVLTVLRWSIKVLWSKLHCLLGSISLKLLFNLIFNKLFILQFCFWSYVECESTDTLLKNCKTISIIMASDYGIFQNNPNYDGYFLKWSGDARKTYYFNQMLLRRALVIVSKGGQEIV